LFTALLELDLSSNGLTSLPKGLSGLSTLATLNVSKNYLSGALFGNIFTRSMSNLSQLDASSNALTSISDAVGELPNLTSLDVSGNDICSIPEELKRISTLISVNAMRNPLVDLPVGLVSQERDIAHSIPVAVAPGLLVGAADASTNRRALRHYGVTHIIALGKVIAPEWPDSSTLLLEHVDEDGDLVAMLPNILGFITTALRCGAVHGQPVALIEDTPKFYQMAIQGTPSGTGFRSNLGVSEVGNEHWSECVSTMDAPTTTDTNSRARVLICGLRGSTVPAAVAAAWLMGCEGLSVSSATTQVLGAISACETMLKAAPNNNFIQQLRTLEQDVNRTRAKGAVQLDAPCWTRHLEPDLVLNMSTAPMPIGHDAAVAMVALLQEATENQADVSARTDATKVTEEELKNEDHKDTALHAFDKLNVIRHNKAKALARGDEIEADIKLLALSAAVRKDVA